VPWRLGQHTAWRVDPQVADEWLIDHGLHLS
jgi:hypothetical protein